MTRQSIRKFCIRFAGISIRISCKFPTDLMQNHAISMHVLCRFPVEFHADPMRASQKYRFPNHPKSPQITQNHSKSLKITQITLNHHKSSYIILINPKLLSNHRRTITKPSSSHHQTILNPHQTIIKPSSNHPESSPNHHIIIIKIHPQIAPKTEKRLYRCPK